MPFLLNRSPAYLLHQADLLANALFETRGARTLSARQFAVLTAVARHDGVNQTEITALTRIDRSTMTEIVRRLVRKGLLERRRSRSDGRVWTLKLSDQGWRELNAAETKAIRVGAAALHALPDARQEAFVACLESLVRKLEAPAGTKARRPALRAG